MKPVLILRPEPGNAITASRAQAIGLAPLACPLFAVDPVPWTAPDPRDFDHLLLTSANALRHGGAPMTGLTGLGVVAVGQATAEAARVAGFEVVLTGDGGVDALLASLPGAYKLLHLAGADHRRPATHHAVETRIVYRAVPLTPPLPRGASVAMVHSPRAGARLAALAPNRADIAIAAISAATAAACGGGWATIESLDRPDESALLALAARLCQD